MNDTDEQTNIYKISMSIKIFNIKSSFSHMLEGM